MSFVLRMVWREVRSSWLRLGFFFVCVGLGVASIVVVRSVVQQVRNTLTREARGLIGADVVVQTQRPWTPELRSRIDAMLAGMPVEATTNAVETQTMASAEGESGTGQVKLVELFGVESPFPFYGRIELDGGLTYSHALLAGHGVIVEPELLSSLGVRQGDVITLAGQSFTIRGVITRDRLQRGGIAFGPRAYIDLADLRQTSLLGFGSRSTYRWLIRLREPGWVTPATNTLRAALRKDLVSVRSWQTLEERIGRNLRIAENYLSLVGFAIVVLGGIGVWSVTRVIVRQKIRSVAILKCVGASSRHVFSIYVLQVMALAVGGSVVGLVLGALAISAIPVSVVAALGVDGVSLTASAALQGVAVGILVSLLFALVPLVEIRSVKPLILLRGETAGVVRRPDWRSRSLVVAIGAALAGVAMWQAASVRTGAYVFAGLVIVSAVLLISSLVLVRVVRPLLQSERFFLRHAVLGLTRPGNQTRVILMAVGLGTFFILGVRSLQSNLVSELAAGVRQGSPDLILIDVQKDQVDSLKTVVAPYLRDQARVVPLMRGRVVEVRGRRLKLATVDEVRDQGRLSREFGVTFRTGLEANEALVAGQFWNGPQSAGLDNGIDAEVSIERDLQRDSGLELDDLIRFDFAGGRLLARVTSVRAVTWEDSQNGGFVFVLRPSPAVLDLAHNYVGFLQVKDDASSRGALQRDVVRSHPNVSVIDVRDVLASIKEVIDNVTLGVTVVGAVVFTSGILILIGAVAMTRYERLYQVAIYRTLGASARLVTATAAVEYGLVGTLAGIVGAGGALALSWALARFLFEIEWQPAPVLLAGGVLATSITVCVVGLAASADVLRKKPLGVLRGG